MENEPLTEPKVKHRDNLLTVLYILGTLLLFLFALDLMISSLQHLGKGVSETIIMATSNPFTALFIGLLITAMIQSSSATTSMTVALVASGAISLESAIPIIMGANVGTTITSTIVSLGFINKKKEFRRAVAGGTYHSFFNILTVLILFPLEYYFGFLSTLSERTAHYFFSSTVHPVENKVSHLFTGFDYLVNVLLSFISNGFILIILSVTLLFASILLFRRLISELLKAKSPEAFSRFFFRNPLKSFSWGLLTTAAIRSSTITTSVVVPIVAKKIVTLKQAAPFIMGANIGTTITAFIAATLNSNTASGISIAIAHFFFNFIGVMIFFPIPVLRKIPIELASSLGRLTLKYRLAGFVYILLTFFFIPFALIYLNQNSASTLEMTYEKTDSTKVKSVYRMISKINIRTQTGEWLQFEGAQAEPNEEPSIIFPVYLKDKTFFVGKEMFLFNKPGFCWDGENEQGTYKACIREILPTYKITSGLKFDSVYVCESNLFSQSDTTLHRYYLSAPYKILLKHEVERKDHSLKLIEEVVSFEIK